MLDPMSMAKTDLLEYLNEYGELLGIPAKVGVPKDQAEAEIAQIKEQQAQQAQQDKALNDSTVARNLGSADATSGTALAELKNQFMP